MREDNANPITTSAVLEPPNLVLDELPVAARPTLGEQQLKMALAALMPPVQRLRLAVLDGPWVLAPTEPAHRSPEVEPAHPKTHERRADRTLRCPYCRSMTYEVSVTSRPKGLVAVGACSLCGTRGESFRPARRRRLARRTAKPLLCTPGAQTP